MLPNLTIAHSLISKLGQRRRCEAAEGEARRYRGSLYSLYAIRARSVDARSHSISDVEREEEDSRGGVSSVRPRVDPYPIDNLDRQEEVKTNKQ